MIKRRAKKCHSHDPGGTSFAFSGIVCKCAICDEGDLNSRGSLRRKINMSVNVLKIHVLIHKRVGKRDWKGNRTKSLRNSSSVKDSIAVLIVMIERKFPLYFLSFLPAPLLDDGNCSRNFLRSKSTKRVSDDANRSARILVSSLTRIYSQKMWLMRSM